MTVAVANFNGAPEGRLFYGRPLVFREKAHRYYWGGEPIPSVTTILGIMAKPALIQWAANMAVDHLEDACDLSLWAEYPLEFRKECDAARKAHAVKKETAADLGSTVHEYAQRCLAARELTPLPISPETHPACEAFREWYRQHQIQTIDIERMVLSQRLGYAGRCDFFGRIDGDLGVLDFKTSNGIYPEFWIQLTAYEVALTEELGLEGPLKRWLLHLDKKTGKFSFKERTMCPATVQAWAACVMLDKMLRVMKDLEKKAA